MSLVVVRTGTANTASVIAGLRRAGVAPALSHDPDAVRAADAVVLPGVGAFGAAMSALGPPLAEALAERARQGRPLLAICLGLQLLAQDSEETPGVAGLGVLDAHVTRLPDTVRVPHLGWNLVVPTAGARLLTEGHASFAHSFRLERLPPGWEGAFTDHGGPCVAAVERGPVLACQFHPELSGAWGQALLDRWCRGASC